MADSDASMAELSNHVAALFTTAIDRLGAAPKRFFPTGVHEVYIKATTVDPSLELKISSHAANAEPLRGRQRFLIRPMYLYPGKDWKSLDITVDYEPLWSVGRPSFPAKFWTGIDLVNGHTEPANLAIPTTPPAPDEVFVYLDPDCLDSVIIVNDFRIYNIGQHVTLDFTPGSLTPVVGETPPWH